MRGNRVRVVERGTHVLGGRIFAYIHAVMGI
jgi:hypothetical protein